MLVLLALNAYVCWRVFRLEWNSQMDSIEGTYIGISRHILAIWRHVGFVALREDKRATDVQREP